MDNICNQSFGYRRQMIALYLQQVFPLLEISYKGYLTSFHDWTYEPTLIAVVVLQQDKYQIAPKKRYIPEGSP